MTARITDEQLAELRAWNNTVGHSSLAAALDELAERRAANGDTWRDQLVAVCEAIGANDAAEVIARIGPMARELVALRAVRDAADRLLVWMTPNGVPLASSYPADIAELRAALASLPPATPGGDR